MIYVVTRNKELFENPDYKIIGVDRSLSLLKPLNIVGLDTETSGLDCHKDKLLSLQLGCYEFQVVIDCLTIDITFYKEYLESDRLFIGWNLKFDLKWLFKYKIVPKNVYDGFLAEKLMWLGYPKGFHSMSLKSAGSYYLGIELDKTIRGQIIYKGLVGEVINYAALDVKYLEKIKDKQYQKLKEQGLLTAMDYENRFILPLSYMEFCGVKIDIEKWKYKMSKDNERLSNALNLLNKWLLENEPDSPYIKINTQGDLFTGFNLDPIVTINWNSAKQVIPLFKKYNIHCEIEDKEKGGNKDSIDAKVLKPQKDKCSLIPIYLDYKEAVKVTSTYGENFLKQINPDTGRIYTNFNQIGTDTVRISSGGKDKSARIEYINFLNLPSDELTRACFVAEEGNKWISIDYSGQESVIMADIANDKAMIHELMEGEKDLHTLTAKLIFSQIPKDMSAKEVKKKFHKERQESKGYEFAFNYAGNDNTIIRNFGLAPERAKEIYDSYMQGFTGLKKYQDFRKEDWWIKGYIDLNPLVGYKAYIYDYKDLIDIQNSFKEPRFWDDYRRLKQINPEDPIVQKVKRFFKRKSTSDRQSVNYPIQHTGALCSRVAIINFFEYLRSKNLLFKVLITIGPYDEWNCEAPENIAEEIAQVLYNCMIKSGTYFCKRCRLDAEISRLENGELPTYWIH